MFQNDFFIIADYFFQMRKTGTYQGSDRNVRHMREVLQLLSALTNDPRFIWKTYAEKEGAEPKNIFHQSPFLRNPCRISLDEKWQWFLLD